ncbi:MAG: response regulator, partial [Tatlockia sp.]|nr:response regulator [Tatlockia sp.]
MIIKDARPTCFYHPIKVIFLDDNRVFLEALDLEFSTQINMLMHTNPDATMQEINSHSQDKTPSIFKIINDVNLDTTNNRVINFDVSNLLNL